MKDVYCPLSIMGGHPMQCVDLSGAAMCSYCPTESLYKLSECAVHLTSAFFNAESIDVPGLQAMASALESIADALS